MIWYSTHGLWLIRTAQANCAPTHRTSPVDQFSTKKVQNPYTAGIDILPNHSIVAGQFFYEDLIPTRTLESAVPSSLEEEEKLAFLSFDSGMLAWLPVKRKKARELMEQPFLKLER